MNYFSTLFIGSIGACLLSSCTHYFDLDKVAEPSKLVVYCYPGIGDTTVVHLSRRRRFPKHKECGCPDFSKRQSNPTSTNRQTIAWRTGTKLLRLDRF